MNEPIYKTAAMVPQSTLQKLFNQLPYENAVIEVNNLLATETLRTIASSDIEAIEKKYGLNLNKEFRLNMEEFYAVYLNYCLADRALNEDEAGNLRHLKIILGLDDKTIQSLHSKIIGEVYKVSYEQAVADGRLTEDEKYLLQAIETNLQISTELANKISAEVRTQHVNNYVANATADQRLSPEEEREMQTIADSLSVQLNPDDRTREKFEKYKSYWQIDNQPLPEIYSSLALQGSEKCHMAIENVKWYEMHTVEHTTFRTETTTYKVSENFYSKTSRTVPSTYTTNENLLMDQGTLYLTSERVILTGRKGNLIIPHEKIVHIEPYKNGLMIGRDYGKNPMFITPQGGYIFAVMLQRLVRGRG